MFFGSFCYLLLSPALGHMFLGSLYCKQYGSRSDCSQISSLIRIHSVCLNDIIFYFILSSEIIAYQKQIKVISITCEMIWYQSLVIDISLYFHCSVFFDHLWLFHSLNAAHFESLYAYNFLICEQKHQVWVVIFLVRTWGTIWYQNNSDLLNFFIFEFSTPPASVSEAMHVTYATQRHQQIMTSLMTSLVSHFDAEYISFYL